MKLAEIRKKKDDIKLNEANMKIVRNRERELLQEIKDVEDNTKKIMQARNRILEHAGNVSNISVLLYSTTIQQNIAYLNHLKDQLSGLKKQEKALEVNIEKLNEDINSLNNEIGRLKLRKTEGLQAKIDDLNAEIGRLKLRKNIISNIRVIQAPEASVMPVKPKKALNVSVAGVLGFMIMVFLAFFLEYIQKAKAETAD